MESLNDLINADLKIRKVDLLAMAPDLLEDDVEPPNRLKVRTDSNGVNLVVTMDFATGEVVTFERVTQD